MGNIYAQIVNTSSLPPSVMLQVTADDAGIATPAANNLNILTNDSTANNANGIQTTAAGDTVTIQLTNRLQGSGSTVGAVTNDLVTFDLGATPATYIFEYQIIAFESGTPSGAGYSLFGTVRTDGASATVIGTPDKIVNEEAALNAANVNLVASGNNAILRVTGVAALTINWNSVGAYSLVT